MADLAEMPVGPSRLDRWRWLVLAPPLLSVLLCLALALCYGLRPDACAAITVIPSWAWLVPGLGLAAIGPRRPRRVAILAWLLFLPAAADEPWSLVRAIPRPGRSRPEGDPVRVVSLNCAIGNRLAADEVAAYRPDVVLLQESPNRTEVESLAHRLFGDEAGVVYGVDASLIVRGRVAPAELPRSLSGYFVEARVTLANGREIEVVSTRLLPAVFRADLWSPDCWREQAENRRARRAQLRAIAARVEGLSVPVIVGGDFNAPQGDAVFRLLQPRLRDTFAEGGRGWGNTILNGVPVLRIDQVWASREFRVRSVAARSTRHSDHRMVVADLILSSSR